MNHHYLLIHFQSGIFVVLIFNSCRAGLYITRCGYFSIDLDQNTTKNINEVVVDFLIEVNQTFKNGALK
ncbi:hypothetical protein C9980_07005 [Vibrio mediterranei]|nr:hypothetical protein C9980_07005 [Vibrio mediterranei]